MKKTARQLQKEQTRALLLKTAFQVFSEKGILASRMSDVAAAAGVSHGTVFAHFSSQEELVSSVIETYGSKIALRTHELAEGFADIRSVLAAHLKGVEECEAFYTRLVVENTLLPPAARDVFVSLQSAVSFHLSRAARREMDAGTIKSMPIHLLFNGWIALIHYYLANRDLFAPEGNVIKRYGETLLNHYMTLLTPGENATKRGE